MSNETFKYRAIAAIRKGELSYTLSPNESLDVEIELLNNQDENYRLLATFDTSANIASFKGLILEQTFQSEQNCDKFRSNTQKIINTYFNKLKFLHREYSAVIDSPDFIIEPNGNSIHYITGGIVIGGSIRLTRSCLLNDSKQLGKMKDNFWDECVERFNSTMTFQDPVLRLISLYAIAELINHLKNNLPIDDLIRCTRNLVAHGIVDKGSTPRILSQILGQATAFRFSRKDGNQMNLVKDSATKLAEALEWYLMNQLPG